MLQTLETPHWIARLDPLQSLALPPHTLAEGSAAIFGFVDQNFIHAEGVIGKS